MISPDEPISAATALPGAVDCAVIVVTHNSERHILAFLQSIEPAAGRCSWRVVVVDNASSDRTAECVARFPAATFVPTGSNLGYAGGINVGRRLVGEFRTLLIANPDVRFRPLAIERMHEAVIRDGREAVVPLLLGQDGTLSLSLRRELTIGGQLGESVLGDHFPKRPPFLSEIVREPAAYGQTHTVDWATGAVLMVSAKCDDAVGDWNESYFLFSEETDYAARIRAAGFSISYVPEASAVHDEGGSGRASSLLGMMAVNRLRYYRHRHSPLQAGLFWMALMLGLFLRAADRSHRQALVTLLRCGVPGVLLNRFPPAGRLVARLPDRSAS